MTELEQLRETNYMLSQQLAGAAYRGHVTHLFGRPLNEIADILEQYEETRVYRIPLSDLVGTSFSDMSYWTQYLPPRAKLIKVSFTEDEVLLSWRKRV